MCIAAAAMQTTRWPPALLLVCFLLCVPYAQGVKGQCYSFLEKGKRLPVTSELTCPHVCPAQKGWEALPALWMPVHVEVNCSSKSYTVLTADSEEALAAGNVTAVRWCGFRNLFREPTVCSFKLSPLQDTYFAVEPGESGGLFSTGHANIKCEVDSSVEANINMMALTVLGIALFYNAARLTMSVYFRLTSGSLMFMSGAVVVLAFMFMRTMPYKRSLFAFFTISTSSMMALVRWIYGEWMPDMYSLATSKPFIGYLLVTGSLGLAVTYWFDNTENVKLNTTIRVTLQLVGLLMVYNGIADERVAVAAVLLLVFSGALYAVGRRLVQLICVVGKGIALVLRWLLRSTWRLISSTCRLVFGAPKHAVTAAPSAVVESSAEAMDAVHKAAGSPLYEPAEGEEEPILSDEEDAAAARRRQRPRQPQQGSPYQDASTTGLFKSPSLRAWQQRNAGTAAERSPIHLKQQPPLSPGVVEYQALLRGQQQQQSKSPWRQQEVVFGQQRQVESAAAGAAVGYDAGAGAGYRFPSSTPVRSSGAAAWTPASKSPWSEGKVVMDVRNRPESPPQPAAEEQSISPLVAAGKIINPETGRPILIGRAKYNDMIEQGYTPDRQKGVLAPPGGTAAQAVASAFGQSSGGSVQSPASSLRVRRPR